MISPWRSGSSGRGLVGSNLGKSRWATPDPIMSLAWSDGQRLAFGGCSNGDIEAWDISRGKNGPCPCLDIGTLSSMCSMCLT